MGWKNLTKPPKNSRKNYLHLRENSWLDFPEKMDFFDRVALFMQFLVANSVKIYQFLTNPIKDFAKEQGKRFAK